jgi:predicted RNase H-like HicB family nuclease
MVTSPAAPLRQESVDGYVPLVSWHFSIETEREADERWIAEIPALPGVLAYGPTEADAFAAAEALALRVLADRLEHGEASKAPLTVSFAPAAG